MLTNGAINASGNVSGNYFLGNVFYANGITASKIYNGTSEANVGTSGGNANISIGGTSNVAVFATTGLYVTGLQSVTGNVSANGNIAGNYLLANIYYATGFSASRIFNGTSEANIGTSGGNANISIGGVSNVVVFSTAGEYVTGLLSVTGNTTAGNILTSGLASISGNVTTSGQLISTKSGSATTGEGQLYLNGSTNNRIDFNTNGLGAPATTTRSDGTKVVLYPALGGSTVDYALGINAGTLWSSIPGYDSGQYFKWYGATTEIASLNGTGAFSVAGNVTGSNVVATTSLTNGNITITGANIVSAGPTIYIDPNGSGGADGNVVIAGNLTVQGTVTTINTQQLVVNDNIFELGSNNTLTDAIDSGFYSPAGNSTAIWYSGIARIAASAAARANVANNVMVFTMPKLQGGAGSAKATYHINAQSIGVTGGGNPLYNPEAGANPTRHAANLVITGATANALARFNGERIINFTVSPKGV
jgi:hypothetical protein